MDEKPASKTKTLFLWIVIFAIGIVIYGRTRDVDALRHVEYPKFLELVEAGQVGEVEIDSNSLTVTLWETGERYETIGFVDDALQKKLSEHGVRVSYPEHGSSAIIWWLVAGVVVLAILIGVFGKVSAGAQGGVFQIGKSRARLVEENGTSFEHVGGCEEAKERLGDAIAFLREPALWIDSGVRLPRGILLSGPPGCGKTLLARAVAGETQVPFYHILASEFVEMFIGVGAARVRDMFEQAKKNAPAIVFIDELDAVGRRRGSGVGSGHDEREQTLNQLLVSLDGFEANESVVVIAATNRADILDPALLRPGRFDVQVEVGRPDEAARLATLAIHTEGKTLSKDVSLERLADRTRGVSGADLENLTNEAGIHAVRRAIAEDAVAEIREEDFERALATARERGRELDELDAVLIESATQLAQPSGRAVVRIETVDGQSFEGEVVWADGFFVKLRPVPGGETSAHVLVAKSQIRELHALHALEGTAAEDAANVASDLWTGAVPEFA